MIEYNEELDLLEEKNTIPSQITISQNHPNPFNPETNFIYSLNKSGRVTLKIYDVLGQLIYTVFDGVRDAGTYSEVWNSIDNKNCLVASGVYLYRLQMGEKVVTKKMVLSK